MKDGDCTEIWEDRLYGVLERVFVVEEEEDDDDMEVREVEDEMRLKEALSWRSRSENRVVMDARKGSSPFVGKSMSKVMVRLRLQLKEGVM